MPEKTEKYKMQPIENMIMTIRGQKVILDADLARIYGVPTKRLNEQVRRNPDRFPPDFGFILTNQEVINLKSQFATSSFNLNRSQFETGATHGGRRKLPMAFTEHGAIMAANVLRSKQAIQMSVFVVRAFIRMRQMLVEQRSLARKLAELEKELTARLDVHETAINEMLRQIRRLLSPQPEPEPPKKRIGFLGEEPHVAYSSLKQLKKGKR
jgi:phage regulator Rha-like protein